MKWYASVSMRYARTQGDAISNTVYHTGTCQRTDGDSNLPEQWTTAANQLWEKSFLFQTGGSDWLFYDIGEVNLNCRVNVVIGVTCEK